MWNRPYWRPFLYSDLDGLVKPRLHLAPKIEKTPRKSKHNLNPNIPLTLTDPLSAMDTFPPVFHPSFTASPSRTPTCVDYCGSGPYDLFGAHTFDRSGVVCSIFGLFLEHIWRMGWIWMDMDRYGWIWMVIVCQRNPQTKNAFSVELAMVLLKLSIFVWRGASRTRVSLISFACRRRKINSINETASIRTTLR